MTKNYYDLVESDEKTCGACPTQWEGKLKDGREFYFRYRHGWALLLVDDFNNDEYRKLSARVEINRMADGCMDDDEYREVFVKLYNELA